MLRYILFLRWHVSCLVKHVEIHFVPLLAWDWFDKHKLRFILYPRCHRMGLVNIFLDTIYFVAGMEEVRSAQIEINFVSSQPSNGIRVFNSGSDVFCVLAGMGGIWSTHVEIHFVCSLAVEGFGQHMLRFVLVWLLAVEGFSQHMLRYIYCPCWHMRTHLE